MQILVMITRMRNETISENITVTWRDERLGRVSVQDPEQVKLVSSYFGFVSPNTTDFELENDFYSMTCRASGDAAQIVIRRKPQGTIQEFAWHYAEETRQAKIIWQDDELGVHFLDEDQFVPFSKLDVDPKRGFIIL